MINMNDLDAKDWTIVANREGALDETDEPRIGDYIEFADGITRRVSHVYSEAEWQHDAGVQTTDGGSFYLGDGYVSYSGSLYPAVRMTTLTRDFSRGRLGSVWIFHHDHHTAHNGVDTEIKFRVYRCSESARPAPVRRSR